MRVDSDPGLDPLLETHTTSRTELPLLPKLVCLNINKFMHAKHTTVISQVLRTAVPGTVRTLPKAAG